MFTFPLRNGDERLGALDLYCDTPGQLDAGSLASAQTLADVVAVYLLNAQTRADLLDNEAMQRRLAEQLASAQQVAAIGSWEWDIPSDAMWWSDELCRICGIGPGRYPAPTRATCGVPPRRQAGH